METVNLNQLTAVEGGVFLLGEVPFSGFAIETFPDGRLATQMPFMHGLQDGVTRRWHSNGQLKSEQSFREGKPHGWRREWRIDGTLESESSWNAGACIHSSRGDGILANLPSAASDNCVMTYEYDSQGRQTCVRIEPGPRPLVCVPDELPASDDPADEPTTDPA